MDTASPLVRINPATGQKEVAVYQEMTDDQINSELETARNELTAADNDLTAATKRREAANTNVNFLTARKAAWDGTDQATSEEPDAGDDDGAAEAAGDDAEAQNVPVRTAT